MCQIIGQDRLRTIIDNYSIQTLPKTLMLLGPDGCGKHTFAKYISNRFSLDYLEISDNLTSTGLDDFLYKTVSTLYVINLDIISEKQQNQILKFIEEPSKSVYVILLASSEAGVLNTVLNRCIKYYFEPYTREQLEQITKCNFSDLAYKMFTTPGKLTNLTNNSFNELITLAKSVVFQINYMSYPAALGISTKINYKDLYSKVDFKLFFDAIEFIAFEDFKINNTEQSFKVFKVTNQFRQQAARQNLNKEILMLNYLTTLWETLHYDLN